MLQNGQMLSQNMLSKLFLIQIVEGTGVIPSNTTCTTILLICRTGADKMYRDEQENGDLTSGE